MSTNVTLQSAPVMASALQPFCEGLCAQSRCAEWGIPHAEFEQILLTVGAKYLVGDTPAEVAAAFFKNLKVEELALARGCAAGHERAWEVFLTRYREKLFEMALGIAREATTARELADSLYADLYGINSRGERVSKLASCTGRGSLEGWLRTVLAQEFVNRYRKQRRITSLDEEVEQGRQFAAQPQETAAPNAGLADPEIDPRLDLSITSVLDSLTGEDRYVLASYFLDGEECLDTDVRDLKVDLRARLTQESRAGTFSPREVQAAPRQGPE